MTDEDYDLEGYHGDLGSQCVTIAEVLKNNGYSTYMSGKWHVTRYEKPYDPKHNWPCQRGFKNFYGIIAGASNYFNPSTLTRDNQSIETPKGEYYVTDAISDEMCNFVIKHKEKQPDNPFFAYLSYTAPHWPLHALPEDIERYEGQFDMGWDELRELRYRRMIKMHLIDFRWKLTPRDPAIPEWEQEEHKAWQARRMEVYAAQIDRMDQGIGRVVETLSETGQFDDTLIIFLSDNGACAEELDERDKSWIIGRYGTAKTRDGHKVCFRKDPSIMPGLEDTYQSYGLPWANVSNTPFREYKHWVHEGGIATPLIVHWPDGFKARGELRRQPGQLPDIMATCLDVTGAEYPATYNGNPIHPLEGHSLKPFFKEETNKKQTLYFEHEGNCAIRKEKWKLVCKYPKPWELYNMEKDGTETENLAEYYTIVVKRLSKLYGEWADRCKVLPWDEVQKARQSVHQLKSKR
jgi:arylsulfatase